MKERLDVLLVKRGLAESREKAKAIIMSGIVFVDNEREDKAGTFFKDTVNIEVRGKTLKYVSRGGLKLEKAMDKFGVTLDKKICMDVGASTGGFTDCMLQNGAVKVYSVDVGHGQLAWKLVDRLCNGKKIASKVLLPVRELLTDDGEIVCLIKPQFEAGREKVGKKGVVRDKNVHIEVINNVIEYAKSINFKILNLDFSPVKGPEGNIEYLLYLKKKLNENEEDVEITVKDVVENSHKELDK